MKLFAKFTNLRSLLRGRLSDLLEGRGGGGGSTRDIKNKILQTDIEGKNMAKKHLGKRNIPHRKHLCMSEKNSIARGLGEKSPMIGTNAVASPHRYGCLARRNVPSRERGTHV